MIVLAYGYHAGMDDFDEKCATLEKEGVRYYVCPGTSGWCGPSGRVKNMLGNVKEAYEAGARHGAEGMMVCDWGDGGHHQPWIVALPSLVYAASLVKGQTLSRDALAAKIDELTGAKCGLALLAYGDFYLATGAPKDYWRLMFNMLTGGEKYQVPTEIADCVHMADVFAKWRETKKGLVLAGAPEWVKDDFATMDLLYTLLELRANGRHPETKEFEAAYRALWLMQNRPGGLDESCRGIFGN